MILKLIFVTCLAVDAIAFVLVLCFVGLQYRQVRRAALAEGTVLPRAAGQLALVGLLLVAMTAAVAVAIFQLLGPG